MATKWPHLLGKDADEAVEFIESQGYRTRVLKPGMTGLSLTDGRDPMFVTINVDVDDKVVHLTR